MNRDEFYFFWKHQFGQWTKRDIVDAEGVTYNCCEQYMMYHKALIFGDDEIAERILAEKDPAEQQKLGRQVRGYRSDLWDEHRFRIVWQGNFLKFTQQDDLRDRLLATGNRILAEASPYDLIWGVGFAAKDEAILNRDNWKGLNLLGKVLTSVRSLLRKRYVDRVQTYDECLLTETMEKSAGEWLEEREKARSDATHELEKESAPWKSGRFHLPGVWHINRIRSDEGKELQEKIEVILPLFPEIPEELLSELIRDVYDRVQMMGIPKTAVLWRLTYKVFEYAVAYPQYHFPLEMDEMIMKILISPEDAEKEIGKRKSVKEKILAAKKEIYAIPFCELPYPRRILLEVVEWSINSYVRRNRGDDLRELCIQEAIESHGKNYQKRHLNIIPPKISVEYLVDLLFNRLRVLP